ncbi:CYTH domain-containing protein, partial [Staphylococcus capitis]
FNVLDEELVILGDLKTYRIETQYQNELLVLDKSEYLNKVDYELEYEVGSYDEGYEKFKQLLQEFDIKHKKPLNKVQRFFEEKKKASDK